MPFDQRDRWIAAAVLYTQRYGMSVIPVTDDSDPDQDRHKKPLVKWGEYQNRLPSIGEILQWAAEGLAKNLAIVTGIVSGIVVVDCESREDAEWFARERSKSAVMVQTKRGYHFYFKHTGENVQNALKVKDETGRARYDVRGDGGYVVAPPSLFSGGEYLWLDGKEINHFGRMPNFNPEWRPQTRTAGVDSDEGLIRDGARYISKIVATAGGGGHDATYRAAMYLKESGMSEAEAFLVMQDWNQTNAIPPWSNKELLHKVKSAFA